MLELQNICKVIDKKLLLNDINLKLEQGQIIGLLGPNGAGKTTLFSILIGLIKPTSGLLIMNSKVLNEMTPSKRILQGLCYLPQESSLFGEMTVLSNIECALELHGMSSSRMRRCEALELLNLLNIKELSSKKALVLSGGQRRRVEFARLLACKPKFVLLDEPFAGVDPLSIADIQSQIHLLRHHEIGVLLSDHNVQATLSICEQTLVLIDGEIIAAGTQEELINHPKVQQSYLGSSWHKVG